MQSKRPKKVWKLSYWSDSPNMSSGVSLYGDPGEVRIFASEDRFLSVHETGVSFSPGIGNSINIQGLPQNMKYGGLLTDTPFPLSLIPITIATPMPLQGISPPFLDLLPEIRKLASMSKNFVGL